jgi:hypothetical protein
MCYIRHTAFDRNSTFLTQRKTSRQVERKKSVLSTQMQQISENTVARAHQKPIIIKNQCVPISLMVSGFQQPQQQCSTLLCITTTTTTT